MKVTYITYIFLGKNKDKSQSEKNIQSVHYISYTLYTIGFDFDYISLTGT